MSKARDVFRSNESWERWNTHQTTTVEQEVFGSVLRFIQDPSSEHLGTTVWDASVVLAKWFEKNIRKGDFSRAKVRSKRAIELGAGMGLAGMAFAMVGADVVLTDTADVLGLLRINYEANLSPAAVRLARAHQHGTWADSAGSVAVAELDWTKPEQAHEPPLKPPYDFVLAADCIYHETLTEHFHRTVMDITNDKSTVVVCNELRSHSVQGRFMELFTATHSIKVVPHSKMDDIYQHPNIFIYIMKKKKKKANEKSAVGAKGQGLRAGAAAAEEEEEDEEEESGEVAEECGEAADGGVVGDVELSARSGEPDQQQQQQANGKEQQQQQKQKQRGHSAGGAVVAGREATAPLNAVSNVEETGLSAPSCTAASASAAPTADPNAPGTQQHVASGTVARSGAGAIPSGELPVDGSLVQRGALVYGGEATDGVTTQTVVPLSAT